MNTSPEQTFEPITIEALVGKVRALREQGHRLVQIGATRLPDQIELTYSFDLESRLTNLRLHVPAVEARIPSISSVYWCAFLYENEMHDLFNLQVDGMAVDFQGNFYRTTVKFPFGTTKAPVVKATPTAPKPSAPTPIPSQPSTGTR